MWIIVGLGNPGSRYAKTRHNVGFNVIDQLAEAYRITLNEKELYSIGKGAIEGQETVFLKPLTFMNRSGLAVKRVLKKYGIPTDNLSKTLIVVHDDLDLETGVIKIRKGGSSGGHKGIESIIQETGTKDFIRVKVGIGRDRDIPVERYVLSTFTTAEKNAIKDAIINASDAVSVIVAEGIDKAMNRFNRSPRPGRAQIE
ncbi:MAG: aminoacyl-tRNA hydrolase [Nitrospirota bacterium]